MTLGRGWLTGFATVLFILASPRSLAVELGAAQGDLSWAAQPLSEQAGDASRGRALVLSRQKGLCILCHSGPFPEEPFQGQLAPELALSAKGMSAVQLRARLMDPSRFNADTIMPSYFRLDHLNRVAPQYQGKTILSGQEIEDIVAYLLSLNP
jgi:sulfur-oxidizing protein SoxX